MTDNESRQTNTAVFSAQRTAPALSADRYTDGEELQILTQAAKFIDKQLKLQLY